MRVTVILSAIALFILLPALLGPPILHQSFWIDWVWADQFTEQLRAGNLYPRWLPKSHGGLGSPVFYYYPPAAFYLTGALGLAGLSTYDSIIGAFGLAFLASGAAMYLWLKGWTNFPLMGAVAFVLAPYHLLDFYGRGALAETLGIAFIPLIALGMKDQRKALTALSYAGLILTHLPLAVLAIPFLIVPYSIYLWRDRLSAHYVAALPFVVGVMISGIYLVPALLLNEYRDEAQLWINPQLRPEFWSVLRFDWTKLDFFRLLIFMSLLTAALTGALLFAMGRSVWAAWCVIVCAVTAGLLPGFWSIPIIEKVQFPFRALPFAEFAMATAIALAPRSWIGALIFIPALCVASLAPKLAGSAPTVEFLAERHPDVFEYLPPGVAQPGWTTKFDFVLADHHRGSLPFPDATFEKRAGGLLSLIGLIFLWLLGWRQRASSSRHIRPLSPTVRNRESR